MKRDTVDFLILFFIAGGNEVFVVRIRFQGYNENNQKAMAIPIEDEMERWV